MGNLAPPAVGYSVSPGQIVTTGLITPKIPVLPGALYYSDAHGRLLQGHFYGYAAGAADAPYVAPDGSIYLAKVGVGVSTTQIKLQL